MVARRLASPWSTAHDRAPCQVCRRTKARLDAAGLQAAGAVALDLLGEVRIPSLFEAVANALALELDILRVSLLVPQGGGRWRVACSSDPARSDDLVVDQERYPELSAVQRTGAPYVIGDVLEAPEMAELGPTLVRAGVRGVAAFPVMGLGHTGEAVVLKATTRSVPPERGASFLELLAHMLLHRLAWLGEGEVAQQLVIGGIPAEPNPERLLRLLPLAALVLSEDGRVDHANQAARTLVGGPGSALGSAPPRAWDTPGRWHAALGEDGSGKGVIGWTTKLDAGRSLILLEPDPQARRRTREKTLRRAFTEKVKELEDANARLLEHARVRSRFVTEAAHELKTPLAIVRSYLEALATDLSGGLRDDQLAFLETAREGSLRLQRIVDELLDLAALESGHAPLDFSPVEMGIVAAEVVRELAPLARTAGVRVEPPAGNAVVRADRERLRQVVLNLVENAIKYTPRGRRVTVAASAGRDAGVLQVADEGEGIADEALPHLFEEFFRAPGAKQAGGTGLGLALSRRLLQAMGGRIAVRSGIGSGSVFTVEIPLWLPDP